MEQRLNPIFCCKSAVTLLLRCKQAQAQSNYFVALPTKTGPIKRAIIMSMCIVESAADDVHVSIYREKWDDRDSWSMHLLGDRILPPASKLHA